MESAAKPNKTSREQQYKKQNLTLKAQLDNPKILNRLRKAQIVQREQIPSEKKSPLFMHLPQYEPGFKISAFAAEYTNMVPSSVVWYCINRHKNLTTETNQDIIELLQALSSFFHNADFSKQTATGAKSEMEMKLNRIVQFVSDTIGISIALGNIIKLLKLALSCAAKKYSPTDVRIKDELLSFVDFLIEEKINVPSKRASEAVRSILDSQKHENAILVYKLTNDALIKVLAESKPKKLFFVVNGKDEYLQKLLDSFDDPPYIECTVIHLNAVPFYIRNVSFVLMEAKAVFSNGTAFAESGSASIALAAKEYNVPVGFYCESFRFTERVQLDSIVFNDIESPGKMISRSETREHSEKILKWREIPNLKVLNLRYDVVPTELIFNLITEFGPVPPSSVPVLIETYNKI